MNKYATQKMSIHADSETIQLLYLESTAALGSFKNLKKICCQQTDETFSKH